MIFNIRMEIIILIIVVFFILTGHLFCSCAQTTPLEALTNMVNPQKKNGKKIKEGLTSKGAATGPTANIINGGGTLPTGTSGKSKQAGPHSITSLPITKEGFTGANINYGESSMYNEPATNTSSWFTPNLTYSKGKPVSQGVQNILNRSKQPVPLPNGEMLMFKNTQFSPSCCPNTYSNSSGCACMTVDQYNYLIDRGGNNVPYSEY